jgi:DNA replication protein DnaC
MIPRRYENAKIEDVPEQIKTAFNKLVAGGKGFYMSGGVGTGKTHICYALKKFYDRAGCYTENGFCPGKSLIVWNVVDLIHEIKSDFDRESIDKKRYDSELSRTEKILILDDIGAERVTDFVEEKLYYLINNRYINMLPTIFTSNFSITELAGRIGERSASRIVEMCEIFELGGEDKRFSQNGNS